MKYTLSLLDRNGVPVAHEAFRSKNDYEAQKAGFTVLQACKDVAEGYEIRRGDVLVASGIRRRALFDLQTVIDNRQTVVIDLEDRLQHSITAIARSRRLLRTTDRLRRVGIL